MERVYTRKIAYVNGCIVVLNVLAFLWVEFGGSSEDARWMLEHGAMFTPYVIQEHEYYRLVTALFLHFGVNHLANNMLILLILGDNMERALGSMKYLIFYLLCGIGSNFVSMMVYLERESLTVSAGASGAIFGVIGGLLWAVIRNKGHLEDLNTRQLVTLIVLSLYFGFTSTGVNNVAHISGLVIGFLLAIVLYRKPRYVPKGSIYY